MKRKKKERKEKKEKEAILANVEMVSKHKNTQIYLSTANTQSVYILWTDCIFGRKID